MCITTSTAALILAIATGAPLSPQSAAGDLPASRAAFTSRHPSLATGDALVPGVPLASDSGASLAGLPECAMDSLFGQSPHGPEDNNWVANTSEQAAGFRRWENFDGIAGSIESIRFWGLDLVNVNGSWVECEESDPTFEITLHEDAGGFPGDIVCSHRITATRTPTGLIYRGTELNEYQLTLPEPCVLVRGWLSIWGLGDENCWFLWMSTGTGDRKSFCDRCRPDRQDVDLSFCLGGTLGGVFVACCDEDLPDCRNDQPIGDCLSRNERFLPDGQCGDFEPECGIVLGGCCFDDGTCSRQTAEDCVGEGGLWRGPNSPCDRCPCRTPCPPGATREGEPRCEDSYEDEFNGGCDADVERFSPIRFGETVCGEGGVFVNNNDADRDLDWYELRVRRPRTVTWTATAQFPIALWIVDGREGCENARVIAGSAAYECDRVTLTVSVQPGSYYLVAGAVNDDDISYCGAPYVASVLRLPPRRGSQGDRVEPDEILPFP